jgi:hypothetical protein
VRLGSRSVKRPTRAVAPESGSRISVNRSTRLSTRSQQRQQGWHGRFESDELRKVGRHGRGAALHLHDRGLHDDEFRMSPREDDRVLDQAAVWSAIAVRWSVLEATRCSSVDMAARRSVFLTTRSSCSTSRGSTRIAFSARGMIVRRCPISRTTGRSRLGVHQGGVGRGSRGAAELTAGSLAWPPTA